MIEMWVLFAVMILTGTAQDGKPIINAEPFKTQAECEAAKSKVTEALIAKYPTAEASLTCFEAKPIGKLA
jgi:hypothetical protein